MRYFAYGSALSRRHLAEWAAEHGQDVRPFDGGRPARLLGFSLVFDVESRFWGGRVANLARTPGGVVHGLLLDVPEEARGTVLHKEGVATGLSEELAVEVECGGDRLAASAFVARADRRGTPGPPSARLVGYLIEGAKERGLPADWIAQLESLSAAPASPAPGAPVGLGRKPR